MRRSIVLGMGVFISIILAVCFLMTGCGNMSMGFGNYTFEHVHFSYYSDLGEVSVIQDMSFQIPKGSFTALALLIKPLMTELALGNLSLVGSILIFCVGINLVWEKKIRVANLLPAIIFAVAAAFLPFSL